VKRIIESGEKCEECEKRVAKYICIECDMIYCLKCANEADFLCQAHVEPRLINIELGASV
jgi:hypothetical protein